nr:PREDICTED: zinc finger protein 383-like [Stegastes partitus]
MTLGKEDSGRRQKLQHVCKEEAVLAEHQQIKEEHEDRDPPQIKAEQGELCTGLNQNQDNSEPPLIKEEQDQLCTGLSQEDPEPPQLKEEHDQLSTSEKPYLCKTCGKRFSDLSAHRSHTRIHTFEKSYLCNTCGKTFSDLSSFKPHTGIHTGIKIIDGYQYIEPCEPHAVNQ